MEINRKLGFLTVILISLGLWCCRANNQEVTGPPNILFIMGDDHTTQAISSYGGILADYADTRHIDRLANEGVRFTNVFCSNAICSPSRATLLTGKYSHKNGIRMLGEEFDGSQPTVQSIVRSAGYQTAIFGKWHLRSRPTGFDEYKVLPVQGRYQDPEFHVSDRDSLIEYKGWSTDVISDMTIDYLENCDPEKPFMVMCHYKSTHDPWSSRPPYDSLWQNEMLPEPDNLFDDYENRSEAARRTTLKLELMNQGTYPHERLQNASAMEQRQFIYQQYIKSFLRCGKVLDDNVGKVMRYLDESGLAENTIVIYTADQGHFLGEHGFFSKRFMYDEAMRMPLIIRYPQKYNAGSVIDEMITNADFAPTMLEMAGIDTPSDMQGRSFLPILQDSVPNDWPEVVYYHYWQHILHRDVAAHYGVRTRDKKLIFYYGLPLGLTEYDPTPPEWELFDLSKDPGEMNNVYDDPEYSDVRKELKVQLLDLQDKLDDRGKEYPDLIEMQQKEFSDVL